MTKLKNTYRRFIKNTFLPVRFFILCAVVIIFFILSFSLEFIFPLAKLLLVLLLAFTALDFLLVKLFDSKIECYRTTPHVLPLGDEQIISISLKNNQNSEVKIEVVDELPKEFQKRDFSFKFNLNSSEEKTITYNVRPLIRGAYEFGNCNVFVSTLLGLVQHKIIFPLETTIPVYPSSIQVKKHELLLFNKLHTFQGIKKMRKIGHSYEFEQIKNYIPGDDVRTINWKATGRRNQLMVNQFGD